MLTLARTDPSLIGRWWWTVDRWQLTALALLVAFGALLVTAASPPVAQHYDYSPYHFVLRHLVFLVPALGAMLAISLLSARGVRRLAVVMFLGALTLVAATLIIGYEVKGASRWLRLAGMSLQPSEFLKPAFVVVTAWLLSLAPERVARGKPTAGLGVAALLLALVVALLVSQPDMGMTFVVCSVWAAQYFIAGMPVIAVLVVVVLGIGGMIAGYLTLPHVQSRIDRFIDPSSGDSYQIERSLQAFRHGGVTGTGPGQGEVKFVLPDAHADFAFAVAGEEFGLIATLFVVLLFAFIFLRGCSRASEGQDLFALLAASGLLIQFGLQALIHMASTLHLMPTKGMTLPFLSYGGSSLVALGIAMGMMLALTRRRCPGGAA